MSGRVMEGDVDEVGIERIAHLVAELLDQRVKVQLARPAPVLRR